MRRSIERSVSFGMTIDDPFEPELARPLRSFRKQWAELGDRRYLIALLARHHGKVATAAAAAGLNRTYLYRLLRRYGLAARRRQ